jgi:uncharacterized OB-fold protein
MMTSETTVKNYQALLNERKLCAVECTSCHALMLPPRLVCSNCGSKKTAWKQLKGRGMLRSFTVIHIAPTSFAKDAPYVVGIVKLAEGPSITARLVGADPQKPENIHIGDALVADYEAISGPTPEQRINRLIFRPAPAASGKR